VLWSHNMDKPPIGHVLSIDVYDDRVEAVVQFANTPFAREIFGLYVDGDLRAWSIGFLPTKKQYIEPTDEEQKEAEEDGRVMLWGYSIVEEAEMLELSACPVPKNPYTLTKKLDGMDNQEVKSELSRNMVLFDALKPDLPEYTQKAIEAYLEVLATERKMAEGKAKIYLLDHTQAVSDSADRAMPDVSLSKSALSKSMAERVASGKAETEIQTVSDASEARTIIQLEAIQSEEIEGKTLIKEAKILKLIIKMYKAEVTPDDEGRTDGEPTPATPKDQGRTDDQDATGTPDDEGRADANTGAKAISEADMWAEEEKMNASFQQLTSELLEV